MTAKNSKHFFKIIIIGDASVGKSSLLSRYIDNTFETDYILTIGVDFKFKDVKVKAEDSNTYHNVRLQIWDTAGQEKFRSMTHVYFKGSNACIIVFDLTCKESAKNVINIWYPEYKKHVGEDSKVIILGNKSDLKDKIAEEVEEIKKFCETNNFTFEKVSALSGELVKETIDSLAEKLLTEKLKNKGDDKSDKDLGTTKLEINKLPQDNTDCCN